MKTLQEHEDARSKKRNRPGLRWSGIACPDCGLEMEGSPYMRLLTSPPKAELVCSNGHRHYATLPINWGEVSKPEEPA